MNIQELYDALDGLETDANTFIEMFAMSGDLSELYTAVDKLGDRAYEIARAVNRIREALKFED